MNVLSKLAGQTAIYGLSSVIGRTLNYLLVPLYTTVFLPGEYGIVTELYAYVAFLNILYIYGLETAYFRFTSNAGEDSYNSALTSILLTSFVFSGGLILFSEELSNMFGYQGSCNLITWLALIMGIDAIVAIPFARLRYAGQPIRFAVFKLSNIMLNIGLNLFFLIFCPWFLTSNPDHFLADIYDPNLGVGYVFLSNLIANGSYLLFFIPTWIKSRIRLNARLWKEMMTYAWPIAIIGFAGVTNEMLSRAILKYRLPQGYYEGISNIEALGIFGACYKTIYFHDPGSSGISIRVRTFLFCKSS